MSKPEEDEFFIGYAPPMPPRLSRFVWRAVLVMTGLVVISAVGVATGHVPLDGGIFEFGHPLTYRGVIVERPYPAVRLDGGDVSATPIPLLVAPGKHGADAIVQGLNGRRFTFTGTRIKRGAYTMIEIEPASIVGATGVTSAPGVASHEHTGNELPGSELFQVTGEIVDSKCFLGVMVPGSGKTHKECASLCLRGGIPPALYVQDKAGRAALMLMTGPSGESITSWAVEAAGEAITVTGSITKQGGWLVLRTDPRSWHLHR
jgi:hypothetical protein